jgi:hypothetical protein
LPTATPPAIVAIKAKAKISFESFTEISFRNYRHVHRPSRIHAMLAVGAAAIGHRGIPREQMAANHRATGDRGGKHNDYQNALHKLLPGSLKSQQLVQSANAAFPASK